MISPAVLDDSLAYLVKENDSSDGSQPKWFDTFDNSNDDDVDEKVSSAFAVLESF